jgi:hypothetical protein
MYALGVHEGCTLAFGHARTFPAGELGELFRYADGVFGSVASHAMHDVGDHPRLSVFVPLKQSNGAPSGTSSQLASVLTQRVGICVV